MSKFISIIIVTYNREKDIEICLDSVLANDYFDNEIIVVDNASTDNTLQLLQDKYGDKIKLIKSDVNLMAGGGRNLGAKYAKGEYLLFIDSDNTVDANMISELASGMERLSDAGMVGPKMYYLKEPNRVWWAGADINLLTSKTTYIGLDQVDTGQFDEIRKVGHIPNVFMIKNEVWKKVGGIDERFVMHYEESDLAEKIKRAGCGAYIIPTAKTWHNIPLSTEKTIRNFGGESERRTFYTARNRVLFMKRHARLVNYVVFVLFFNTFFMVAYCYNYLSEGKFNLVKAYCNGVLTGFFMKAE